MKQHDRGIPLARHMTVAVVVPVLLMLIMGAVLAWQLTRMARTADDVERTTRQIAKYYDLRSRVVEQESQLRRWMLNGDRSALQLFQRESPVVAVQEIRAMSTDPQQLHRLAQIETNLAAWYELATAATKQDHLVARDDLAALAQRVATNNRARELMGESVAAAQKLLEERSGDSSDAERSAWRAFIVLLGLGAIGIAVISRRQLAVVSGAFQSLVDDERIAKAAVDHREWVRRGEAQVASSVIGERTIDQVGTAALANLCEHTGAVVGALYRVVGGELRRVAAHGMAGETPDKLPIDHGQLGQAVTEGKPRRVRDADTQLLVAGGIAKTRTVELIIVPLRLEGMSVGVVELGFTTSVDDRTSDLLSGVGPTIAIALRAAEQRARLQELLEETQRQGEELQTQHEELRVTNEELEHQSVALREANARQLNIQQELEAANANLEEQTAMLEQQREELLRVQRDLQDRAQELQLASQYKSEFLARMSHELRTPLNSSLILARLLADNPSGNLTEEQIKFANTIYSAGNDLLLLINDILDLAKIEAGRLELRVGSISVARVRDTLVREFEAVAKGKGLQFAVELSPGTPSQLDTDEQRLVQVLRNLVSNACKFTERGGVTVMIQGAGERVRFAVRDTGIGIPVDEQQRVFEAFHQVDGSVSRKHGGTGLGLAISRDLAHLLGGDLRVESEPERGSTFTLDIPIAAPAQAKAPPALVPASPPTQRVQRIAEIRPTPAPAAPPAPRSSSATNDDRERLDPARRTLLVIEDDVAFAQILMDLGRELDFQVLHAETADEGVSLALRHRPDGILLDVNLPDQSGLTVLERIKRQPTIRHVPVHMLSAEDHTQRSLELGAVGYLLKPTTRGELVGAIRRIEDRTSTRVRRLLLVEDDARQVEALRALLGGDRVEITSAETIREAMEHLGKTTFDCVVMDLRLPDGTGFELLEKMTGDERVTFPPVIVHTGKALTEDEEARLRHYSTSIIVKGARSPERLLDEVTLFLHQVEADLPPDRQKILREVRNREAIFEGKRVLIVEDDVRNVFALSSILEPRGIKTTIARNGREALDVLRREPIDLVLMDIMMPEMDGIEATNRIRGELALDKLPVIALTAKAMADDRQACLDAGANDYLAKPINVDMLLSLLRVWMPR